MAKYLYETHLHTSKVSACASCSPAEQVRMYKERGYAGIIVTEHFINGNSNCPRFLPWAEKMAHFSSGYQEAKEEGDRCKLDVFFGWEYNIHGTEFLTYGLPPEFLWAHPQLDALSIEEYSRLVRISGGYLAQAHPFRSARWIQSPFPVAPELIDGIEVYNASMPQDINAKAFDYARLHHLPMQAGSDAHHKDIPFTSGIVMDEKADSIFDIINAIKENRVDLRLPAPDSGGSAGLA